jgi:integrase
MATNAEQLPSGSWRCRVYDPVTKKYKSFTTKVKGKRGKQLVEAEANAWAAGRKPKPIQEKPFGECIDDYIELKSNILSPTTIDKYRNIRTNQLSEGFLAVRMDDLDGVTIQTEINRLAAIYAPKTVINAHGLISATISAYYPQLVYKVTLPKKQKRFRNLPTAEEIIRIFKGTDMELLVLLGMWQGFRASEIRGLRKSDFRDGVLTINRVIVTVRAKHIEKTEAKTTDSRRRLRVPTIIQQMVDRLPGEYITKRSGVSIYKSFKLRVTRAGYPDMTFHDLRHLNASVMLMLGVPDKYAMERGGWSTTSTLKNVYQETFSDERRAYDDRIDDYFTEIYRKIV